MVGRNCSWCYWNCSQQYLPFNISDWKRSPSQLSKCHNLVIRFLKDLNKDSICECSFQSAIFSHKSDSTIANIRLSVRPSVCLSQKSLSLSELCLSAKSQPISAYYPLCQSAIMPISHHAPPLSES